MSTRLRCFFVLGLLLLLITGAMDSYAQWKKVAPGLLDTGDPQDIPFGASAYKDGNVWFGRYDLFVSSDAGTTWNKRTPTGMKGGAIVDIDFYDAFNGAIITEAMSVYLTNDGGLSWRLANIPTARIPFPGGYSVFFIGSDQVIAASLGSAGLIISRDGGNTWTQTNIGTGVPKTFGRSIVGSTAYMIQEDPSYLSPTLSSSNSLYVTNDFGVTWNPTPASTYLDCWSFAVDSCNHSNICIPNEAGTWVNFPNGDSATIFVTSDLGTSWNQNYTTPVFEICGSITASQNAFFAQTSHRGIIRSTDHGASWRSIGGPCAHWDTRYVVAVSDNIIFAEDTTDGSIWGTYNSGGDSLALPQDKSGAILYASDSLFVYDSLQECDPEVTRVLRYYPFGCPPAQIGSILIEDTIDYFYAMSGDSIFVTFRPRPNGSKTMMVLTASNGVLDTVYLQGNVRRSKLLSMSTVDQSTDTIGGTVAIPIEVNGLDDMRDVEMVVRYDPSLRYVGAFSITNVPLDIAGQEWAGHSKIRIQGATSGIVLGHVFLNAFGDSSGASHVDFDSIVVTNPNPPCEYSYDAATLVRAKVMTPVGCGNGTITSYLLSGALPSLSIIPNPGSSIIRITVDRTLGASTIEIVDELGAVKWSGSRKLSADVAQEINVASLATGVYHLIIHSDSTTLTRSLTIIR